MKNGKNSLFALALLFFVSHAYAQVRTVSYDLSALLAKQQLAVSNRKASPLTARERTGITLSANPGDGVAWLDSILFSNGIIDLDIRGKDADQQSFLGIAFHGLDAKTLDVVYFRPFNFRVADSAHRSHAVQYVSQPLFPWQVLRAHYNGWYEKSISPPPDPNGWFHVRIEINYPQVFVFVNGDKRPCLCIKQLNDRKSGKLGLWAGNNSDGAYANLKVTFLN